MASLKKVIYQREHQAPSGNEIFYDNNPYLDIGRKCPKEQVNCQTEQILEPANNKQKQIVISKMIGEIDT